MFLVTKFNLIAKVMPGAAEVAIIVVQMGLLEMLELLQPLEL